MITNTNIDNEEVDKRYILPWLGIVNTNLCRGLDVNYGLYTQCPNKPSQKGFCNYCLYAHKQTGTTDDRLRNKKKLYVDNLDNKEVNYLKVVKNLDINIVEANKYCKKKWSISLPDKYLNPKKRGRPKKKKNTTIVSDTDSDSNNDNKPVVKKRGRPKKEKKKIITKGEKLITINNQSSNKKVILNNIISMLENDMQNIYNNMEKLLYEHKPCNEEIIEVKIIIINKKEFYIDTDNNCYDPSTETLVGLYDDVTKTIL